MYLQIISTLHRRFPKAFTPAVIALLNSALAPPQRASITLASTHSTSSTGAGSAGSAGASLTVQGATTADQKEKEDAARVTRQRPVLRVCAELALVGVIRDAPGRSGAEWLMKILKELVSLLSATY